MPIYMELDGIKGNVQHNRARGGRRLYAATSAGIYSGVPDNAVEVSRISLPRVSAYSLVIDPRTAGAIARMRMLLNAARGLTNGLVVSIPRAARRAQNNLEQLGLAVRGRIPTLEFFVFDIGNPQGVSIELEDVSTQAKVMKHFAFVQSPRLSVSSASEARRSRQTKVWTLNFS